MKSDYTLNEVVRKLDAHTIEEKEVWQTVQNDIREMKNNHLAHIEPDLARVNVNVDWLIKYHWVVATASIGGLIAGLFNLFAN